MNRRLRTALALTATFGAGLLMTACGSGDKSASAGTSPAVTPASSSAAAAPSQESSATPSGSQGGDKGGASSGSQGGDKGGAAGSNASDKSGKGGSDDTAADKKGYGQSCGSNDISWSVSSQSQAGGYYLVKATAKPGITCVIPAALPAVAFGSDGTEAGPAEQSVGQPITLRPGVAAYAGVQPKTTKEDGGKELTFLIVSVADDDPNPVSLNTGTFTVDKPIVTDWHTSAADAVPYAN